MFMSRQTSREHLHLVAFVPLHRIPEVFKSSKYSDMANECEAIFKFTCFRLCCLVNFSWQATSAGFYIFLVLGLLSWVSFWSDWAYVFCTLAINIFSFTSPFLCTARMVRTRTFHISDIRPLLSVLSFLLLLFTQIRYGHGLHDALQVGNLGLVIY